MSKVIIISLLCSLLFLSNGAMATRTVDLLQQGQNFYQQGNFVQAIENWEVAIKALQPGSNQHINTLIRLAAAYQKVGNHYATAYNLLQQALSHAKHNGNPTQQVLVHSYLGDLLLAMQQPDAAIMQLEEQLPLARSLGNSLILANFLNSLGNALSVEPDYVQAVKTYQEVAEIAGAIGDAPLQVQALSNQAQAHFKAGQLIDSSALLEKALSLAFQLPASYDKAYDLLGLGQLALRLQKNLQSSKNLEKIVLPSPPFSKEEILNDRKGGLGGIFPSEIEIPPIFKAVLQLAKQYQDQRLLSYAKGFLGQYYEQKRHYPTALQLTREAIFFAQEIPDILYLWEWQQARLLYASHNLEGALVAYQRALSYLQPIRMALMTGQRNAVEVFYERIRPVYYDFADVLLQQTRATDSPTEKAQWLNQAREVLEQFKAAELENYFQNECVSIQSPISILDNLTQQKHTAIFYPVFLAKRTELLLSLPDGIHQTVIAVGYETMRQTVLEFRRNLQRTVKGSFINQAKQLYQWLIAPLRTQLVAHNIHTLVIVPDGFLRTIPMAPLYDAPNRQFLFQHYALATTPSLTLTDPHSLSKNRENVKVLLNGISEEVQGFTALPSVVQEIQQINRVFSNNTMLLDQNFSVGSINQALQATPYEIVHISSHGQFDRNPKNSFLLTYDDKLTMDRLENLFQLSQLRKQKVELLTLSACQTAVGDERAALGLAGVALKAGAKSALASLWFVDDEATSQLVAEFYQQLKNPSLSKAQALQNAQKKLVKNRKFRHPAYWAPFLLIGNWL